MIGFLVSDEPIPSPTILPCGCMIVPKLIDGVKTLEYAPCSMNCEYLRQTLDEVRAQRKPIRYEER